ncbi:MAG: hypothetical protein MUE73_12065 [Planctomycetes bacterium]|nr:hypothetical protein [Planctomycetota bacterium]
MSPRRSTRTPPPTRWASLAIGLSVKIEFRKLRGEGEAGVLFYGYKAVPA